LRVKGFRIGLRVEGLGLRDRVGGFRDKVEGRGIIVKG